MIFWNLTVDINGGSIPDNISLIGYDGIKLVPEFGGFVSSIRQI